MDYRARINVAVIENIDTVLYYCSRSGLVPVTHFGVGAGVGEICNEIYYRMWIVRGKGLLISAF